MNVSSFSSDRRKTNKPGTVGLIALAALGSFLIFGCQSESSGGPGHMSPEQEIKFIKSNPNIPAADKERALKAIADRDKAKK